MREFLGLGGLISAFGSLANRPADLKRWFVHLLEQVDEPQLLLDVIAMHSTPEATMLLTAAARHVDDPRFAEMIRSAESLHHEQLVEDDVGNV